MMGFFGLGQIGFLDEVGVFEKMFSICFIVDCGEMYLNGLGLFLEWLRELTM